MKKKEACWECGKMMTPGVGMATHMRMMHGKNQGAVPDEPDNGSAVHTAAPVNRRRKTKTASASTICYCPSCGYNLKGIARAMQVE